jgi:hypothetical protein
MVFWLNPPRKVKRILILSCWTIINRVIISFSSFSPFSVLPIFAVQQFFSKPALKIMREFDFFPSTDENWQKFKDESVHIL